MIQFNNTHIFTGYLKQLFLSFNLSTYYDGEWTVLKAPDYFYNKKLVNCTRNYKLSSNVYDSYTHEYLGDFLRFHRDYTGVNLMPLYNCFSNQVCNKLNLKEVNFDSSDPNYAIYMLPVRIGEQYKYTIALDSTTPIELCCGVYGKYQLRDDTEFKKHFISCLINATYKKYNEIKFSSPVLYENLVDIALEDLCKEYLIEHEKDLKLFIKIPSNCESSIVILEGDYRTANNSLLAPYNSFIRGQYGNLFKRNADERTAEEQTAVDEIIQKQTESKQTGFRLKLLNTITNCEYGESGPNGEIGSYALFEPKSQLQLLSVNDGFSHPFSDRLIEYLTGQAITPLDEISDDFARIQEVLSHRYINNEEITFDWPNIWEDKLRVFFYDFMNQLVRKSVDIDGVYYMQDSDFNTIDYDKNDARQDLLGYVDKDVEKFVYSVKKDKFKNIRYKETLSNVDIYPEIYLSNKSQEIYKD